MAETPAAVKQKQAAMAQRRTAAAQPVEDQRAPDRCAARPRQTQRQSAVLRRQPMSVRQTAWAQHVPAQQPGQPRWRQTTQPPKV